MFRLRCSLEQRSGLLIANNHELLETLVAFVWKLPLRPGLIKPEMVKKGQVILALSHPDPESEPELAIECGANYAADGRTINNALAFPGLFRGA